jgi:hypothetical protein
MIAKTRHCTACTAAARFGGGRTVGMRWGIPGLPRGGCRSRCDYGLPSPYFASRMSIWKSSARLLVLLALIVSCVKGVIVLGNHVDWKIGVWLRS